MIQNPNPRSRYIGPSKPKLLNTNLFVGSTWIESDRFKFERRLNNVKVFEAKSVVNANMWTQKQLCTTQTFFFCSTGDEDRMGGSFLVGEEMEMNTLHRSACGRRMARMGNHPMGAWTQRRRTRF